MGVIVKGLNDASKYFGDLDKRARSSRRMAANTAIKRSNTVVRRGIARYLGVAQKNVSSRLRQEPMRRDDWSRDAVAKIWIGLNRVGAYESIFRRIRQTKRGAYAGKHFFQGAFIAKLSAKSRETIYKRVGRERFPVSRQKVDLDVAEVRASIKQATDLVMDLYPKEFVRLMERYR